MRTENVWLSTFIKILFYCVQQNIILCVQQKKESHTVLSMTWGWVTDDRILISRSVPTRWKEKENLLKYFANCWIILWQMTSWGKAPHKTTQEGGLGRNNIFLDLQFLRAYRWCSYGIYQQEANRTLLTWTWPLEKKATWGFLPRWASSEPNRLKGSL